MGGCPLPAEACKRVGNTNTTYKVFHQRRLCDLLPRKKAFHWKPKVGGACISSQMLNLAFQWTANLSVEKGFGVTAQSLLPAEGAFARNQSLPIPQLVQLSRQLMVVIPKSCRPSNSPVGTIFHSLSYRKPMVLPAFQFPSWYNVGNVACSYFLVLPAFQFPSWYNRTCARPSRFRVLPAFQFPSWYNEEQRVSRMGLVLPAFQFPSWYNNRSAREATASSLAGLPIPQLVQFSLTRRTKTRGLAGLPIPQLVQSPRAKGIAQVGLAGLPIPQLVQSRCCGIAAC